MKSVLHDAVKKPQDSISAEDVPAKLPPVKTVCLPRQQHLP